MAQPIPRLRWFLDRNGVEYEVLHHRRDVTARETAADTHTSPKEFAKTIFLKIDGRDAVAVLPASQRVDPHTVRGFFEARDVRFATEEEISKLCPDCEVGAAPPFGNLWGIPIYVSPGLAKDERITFNAGTHEDAIRMTYRDFERLTHPQVVPISEQD